MLTGKEVLKITENKIDKSYSKYLDPTKWNRLFRMGLFNLSEKKYMGLSTQKEFDELRFAVKTDQVFQVRNSKISITPIIITNIVQNGLSVRITTLGDHNLLQNDVITISGVQGIVTIPNINSNFVVYAIVNASQFEVAVSSFISGPYVANTGSLTHSQMIADYLHLFAVKCQTVQDIRNLQVETVKNITPAVVTLSKPNNLATGEKIVISGSPNTSVNGTFFYEAINAKKGRLWKNEARTIPAICTPSTTHGGQVSRVFYNYAEPQYSDRKISAFEDVSADSPKNETADGFLKFMPDTSEITIDYYAKPSVQIDVTDDITDLELVYPAKFIYRLIDEVIAIYTLPSRDALLAQLNERAVTA